MTRDEAFFKLNGRLIARRDALAKLSTVNLTVSKGLRKQVAWAIKSIPPSEF